MNQPSAPGLKRINCQATNCHRCLNPENLRKTELPEQANHGVIHKKPAFTIHNYFVLSLKSIPDFRSTITRSQLLASFADHQSYDVAPAMANPLLSNPLISYRTPSAKVSQGHEMHRSCDFLPICTKWPLMHSATCGTWVLLRSHHDANKREQARNWKQRCKLPNHESWLQSGRRWQICKDAILGFCKTPHRVPHASNGPSITSWSLPRKSPNRTIHCAVSVVAFTGIDMGKQVCLKNSQNLDLKAKRRELTGMDHFLSREFSGAQGLQINTMA